MLGASHSGLRIPTGGFMDYLRYLLVQLRDVFIEHGQFFGQLVVTRGLLDERAMMTRPLLQQVERA
jgi:hypothetical protein